MPIETTLWRITPDGLREGRRSALKSEDALHKWIEQNPRLIGSDLMLIGSEVATAHGGRIDLLAVDSAGTVHVIELKRDKTPRDVVAQALDYASWVVTLTAEDLHEIYRRFAKDDDLARAYKERFATPLPETLNEEHRITIVASALDPSSERIVSYLSEQYGVAINALFFTVFDDGGSELLTRSWLLDPGKVLTRAEDSSVARKERGEWTGFWFVNIGMTQEEDRSWDDARDYGFVSGGQGARSRAAMERLEIGDRIFAFVSKQGYVGYGIVDQRAVMARDYVLADGRPLLSVVKGNTMRQNVDDPERSEYVVAVRWKKTVPVKDARLFSGIFRNQNVVCKIRDAQTADFLKEQFDVQDDDD